MSNKQKAYRTLLITEVLIGLIISTTLAASTFCLGACNGSESGSLYTLAFAFLAYLTMFGYFAAASIRPTAPFWQKATSTSTKAFLSLLTAGVVFEVFRLAAWIEAAITLLILGTLSFLFKLHYRAFKEFKS